MKRLWKRDELRFSGSYEFTRENEKTTTDLSKGKAYWRHDFPACGQRFFSALVEG